MAELAVFNGIDATTGQYLLPPLTADELSGMARGEDVDPKHLNELRRRRRSATESTFGVRAGVDPDDLAQAGWGVVFAADADPAVREALSGLLDHRRAQASATDGRRYREFSGEDGHATDETKPRFLARHGAGPGAADPDVVPYYLLIVGDPARVPFSFQYQLDVSYAVGRIHFETVDEYAAYAASVLAAERGDVTTAPRISMLATANPADRATALSAELLVAPLAKRLAPPDGWTVEALIGPDQATKPRFLERLGGGGSGRAGAPPPAVLFSATHGAGYPSGDPRQRHGQGAIVTQEWPGPGTAAPLDADRDLVSAADIDDGFRPAGMVAFHFACFGAGTPQWDQSAHRAGEQRAQIAPEPFVSALAQRLLSHPRGGALAVVGHVDRAWSYSFAWANAGSQTGTFASCLESLLAGHRLGYAFEYFNDRYAELASDLVITLEEVKNAGPFKPAELAALWTANNDARGYAILGDPAVRLNAAHG